MIIRIITGVALIALLPWGCTVGGGCDSQVDALVERGEQGLYPNALKTELRQLRDAALVFYQRGREAECAAIADGMDELLDDVAQKIETRRELSQRQAYLHSASAVSKIEGILKAEDVVGAEVVNLKDQALGTIENIALNPDSGKIAYVAISTGGLIGLGEKLVAVAWKDLRVPADREIFVLDRSQAALEQMRGFDENRWPAQAEKKSRNTQPAAPDTDKPAAKDQQNAPPAP